MRQFPRSLHLARVMFGLAAASVFCATASLAQGPQPPLVYTVENTGASYPAPVIPDFAHLPIVRPLPDPFVFFNGTRDTTWSSFEQHRNEWMYSMEQYEIGVKPDCHDCTITQSYAATNSTHGTLTINVTRGGKTLTFTSAIVLPTPSSTCVQPAAGWPYVIGMGSATGSWPASAFNASTASPTGVTVAPTGCAATVTYSLNSITVYKGGQQTTHNTDPFYTLYPEYCAGVCNASNGYPNGPNHGQYGAWTWGVSRLIDAIEMASQSTTNPLPLDTTHSATSGCSYAGKMALWSGATDERVALTIAQENGGGGAPSWRISHEIETQGSVEDADDTDYSWFNGTTMHQFSGANIYKLPTDHHELMAMVAPRGLLQTGDSVYYWLGDRSATFDSLATEKIYANYGIGDRFAYYIDDNHSHCVVPAYQQNATQAMINRFMFGANVPTNNLQEYWMYADALQPGLQPTIDPNFWTAWWGTGTPSFPAGEVWNNGGDLMLPLNQNITVNTGDALSTNYDVSMPGTHQAATVTYPYGLAETDIACTDGTSYTLTLPESSGTFAIAANDNSVHPSTTASVANPGCSNGAAGQTTANYFFALGIQNPGAGNPGMAGFTTTDGNYLTAQTDPINVSFDIADTNNGQGGTPAATTTLNYENPYSCNSGCPVTPTLTWTPGTAIYGVPLSAAQLNAAASATQISGLTGPGTSGLFVTSPVPGTFSYSPAAGTILPQGQQTVSVTFTPSNLGTKYTNFTVATASVPITVGTVTITTTESLSKAAGGYQMVVTVKNSGNVTAPNVQLTAATLGSASGATLPASLGDIPSGGSASVTLTFPSSAGADGAGAVEKLSGTYSGGTFGGSFRAVLP